jgi:hypothetical protein
MAHKYQGKSQTHKRKKINKTKRKQTSFSKMMCSPAVKDMAPVRGSCFPAHVLMQLKEYYNSANPSTKIQDVSPTKIWISLKQRLTACTKEDCWLDLITDNNIRKTLDTYIFAPDQPASWKKNPHTWLNTDDIYKVLRQYEQRYPHFCAIRPTPIDFDKKTGGSDSDSCVTDELCKFNAKHQIAVNKTKIGIVFNLDEHDEPGSHWVSLFVDLDDHFAFYLDSAGDPVPNEIRKLVERIQDQCSQIGKEITFYENHPMQHQYGNTECGVYALFFIITMLTGETDLHKFVDVDSKIDFFKKKRIPDKYISKFRELYFNA